MKIMIQKDKRGSQGVLFLLTGLFVLSYSVYELFETLKEGSFVSHFPGDWDKAIGIAVGIVLISRAALISLFRKDCFVEVDHRKVRFRIRENDPLTGLSRSDIKKRYFKDDAFFMETIDGVTQELKLHKIRNESTKKEIKGILKEV